MATVVTKTIKPAGGGDYTTLAAWATARLGAALVDTVERAECYAGNCGGIVSMPSGLSTDATSAVEITAATADRHSGVFSTQKAHISQSAGAACLVGKSNARVRFIGMALRSSGLAIDGIGDFSTAIDCVAIASGFANCNAVNCISIAYTANVSYGFYSTLSQNFSYNNCVAYGCFRGFARSYGIVTAKNCLAQGCADGFNGTFSAASDYNCSDIAGDAPGAHSVTGTVQFRDAANNDFHLATADTVARGAGVNLTSSGITTDIDGQTRPATGAWDIGADQYIALSEDKFGYCTISAQASGVVSGSKSSGLSASVTAVAQTTVRGTKKGQGRAAASAVSAARASGSKAGAGYAIAQAIAQAVVRGEKSVLTNIVVEIIGVMPGAAALLARRSSAKAIAAQHQPPVSISARMRKPG